MTSSLCLPGTPLRRRPHEAAQAVALFGELLHRAGDGMTDATTQAAAKLKKLKAGMDQMSGQAILPSKHQPGLCDHCGFPCPAAPAHRTSRECSDTLKTEIGRLRAVIDEDRTHCLCGCPIDQHESLGEDGEQCRNESHLCLRVCATVAVMATDVRAEVERLRAALSEIAEGRGAFSRDPLTHADNCIRDMKQIAESALQQKERAT